MWTELPPKEYRCRDINEKWVQDIKTKIMQMPSENITTIPVMLDRNQVFHRQLGKHRVICSTAVIYNS